MEANWVAGFWGIIGIAVFLCWLVGFAKSMGEWERKMIEDD